MSAKKSKKITGKACSNMKQAEKFHCEFLQCKDSHTLKVKHQHGKR